MADDDVEALTPPNLIGEALPDRYGVTTGDGQVTDPSYTIFPIIRYDTQGNIHLLGTGFYIARNGLFVTAKHVLIDAFDAKGQQRYAIGMIHFLPKREKGDFLFRPIHRFSAHAIADIAVGVATPVNKPDGTPLMNPILSVSTEHPSFGERVTTFAYPKHTNIIGLAGQTINLVPAWYDGNIEECFPNGRDKSMLPGPCYQTTMVIHGGASGGPVFSHRGSVIGVNSTGWDNTELSFVSRIHEIFQLAIDDVVMGEEPPRRVPVLEIALAGHILVKPPLRIAGPQNQL